MSLSAHSQRDNDSSMQALVGQLRDLIRDARGCALRAVDEIQVRTCWEVGRHIVEFEQGGAARAEYGKRLLPRLAESLTAEFGRGFDASNLRYMRLFYSAFPICDALRHELSWTHYRTLLRVENEQARRWYMDEEIVGRMSRRRYPPNGISYGGRRYAFPPYLVLCWKMEKRRLEGKDDG